MRSETIGKRAPVVTLLLADAERDCGNRGLRRFWVEPPWRARDRSTRCASCARNHRTRSLLRTLQGFHPCVHPMFFCLDQSRAGDIRRFTAISRESGCAAVVRASGDLNFPRSETKGFGRDVRGGCELITDCCSSRRLRASTCCARNGYQWFGSEGARLGVGFARWDASCSGHSWNFRRAAPELVAGDWGCLHRPSGIAIGAIGSPTRKWIRNFPSGFRAPCSRILSARQGADAVESRTPSTSRRGRADMETADRP